MKIVVILTLCLFSSKLIAQQFNGYVLDDGTGQPIAGVTVKAGLKVVSTADNGYFAILNVDAIDTITFNHISYITYTVKGKAVAGMQIFMKKNFTQLKSVVIVGKRNYTLDSIRNRNEFSSIFNYKKPSLKDVFIQKGSDYRGSGGTANSFNSIVSINLLQVAGLVSKNKTSVAKLQARLLNDEEQTYINERISKEKVSQITSLKGDSLQIFINKFKPPIDMVKKMTEYELINYIKKKYLDF